MELLRKARHLKMCTSWMLGSYSCTQKICQTGQISGQTHSQEVAFTTFGVKLARVWMEPDPALRSLHLLLLKLAFASE